MAIVWAVLVLFAMVCCMSAIAGPKFASFSRLSEQALEGEGDGGP
jgi:hypothetical protein